MDRRSVLASLLGGAALALGAAGRKPAAAAVVFRERVPVSGFFFDYCNIGEEVAYQGVCNVISLLTFDRNGGFHMEAHTNCHMDAVGRTSGHRYVANEQDHFNFNDPGPLPSELTQLTSFQLISQGPGGNFVLRTQAHFTVNGQGEVSVFFTDFTAECHG
jgi:hypothetical protein